MKHRKKTAVLLAFTIFAAYLPQGILANNQRPIQEIQNTQVTHQNTTLSTGESSIAPNVQIDWKGPLENPANNIGESTSNYKPNATHYDIAVTNLNDATNTKTVQDISADKFTENAGAYSVKIEEHFRNFLQNGALYKTQIIAKHKHEVMVNNRPQLIDAPGTGEKIPETYYITDFNIQAGTTGGLTLSWEYIPGVSYRLFYDKGNMSSISEMSGVGRNITAQEARSHLNAEGTRVEWTVEGAVPGQIYSAYVLPIGIANAPVDFSDIAFNSTTPKIIHVTPNIPLNIEKLGENKLRLTWNINDSAWVAINNVLYQTVIYKINDKGEEEELGRIYNDNNGNNDVGYFECARPDSSATYRVDFILKNTTNNIIEKGFSAGPKLYTPDEVKAVPYQPIIPEVFPYKEGDLLSDDAVTKYKVKFNGVYDDMALNSTNINQFKDHTFHYDIEGNTANVQLVWDAPQIGSTGQVDYDLYYDIWVSESATGFTDKDKVVSNLKIEEGQSDQLIYMQDGSTVVGMKTTLTELKTNKTYYIKMVAKRKYTDGSESISTPAIKEINIPKTKDEYEPPVVGKPPLQLDSVEENKINVKWTDNWYEIMALAKQLPAYTDPVEALLAKWGHSRVYLTGDASKPIAFRDQEGKYGNPTDLYGSEIQKKLAPFKEILQGDSYILKNVDMGEDVHYKAKVIKQTEADQVRGNLSLEEWVMNTQLVDVENNWEDVTEQLKETTIEGVSGKLLGIERDYLGQALAPNTAYVILISAYRNIDGKLVYSSVPSYILATTATDHKSELETPKTPRLYNYKDKDVRDTEITVRWIYNTNFEYELVYSRLDDPDSAEVWDFTEDDQKTFVDGGEAYVTISGLLPETTYNFWIRAKQKSELVESGEPKVSDWSTPVTNTTLTLAAPLPPSGLGLAAYKSIQEAGKDFSPSGKDYLTVEWMRNSSDINNNNPLLTYKYVVEFADNPTFLDATVVTVDDSGAVMAEKQDKTDKITAEFIAKNIVRFNGLRSNMPYYVRVKTVLTYKNEDKQIEKESAYTTRVRLITNKSSDDYDGGDNDNVIIYDKPVKETFTNGIWTYEIQDVAKVMNEQLNKGNYYYTITMQNYNNKYDAKIRRIKMPKVILDTLIQNGMALKIVTGRGIYDIPGAALKNDAAAYDARDNVQIDLTRMDLQDVVSYVRSYPETYNTGERLEVKIKNTPINRFDSSIKVSMKLPLSGAYNYSNYVPYQYSYEKGEWKQAAYQIDTEDNAYLQFNTQDTGLNAVYEKPISNGTSASSYTMNQIASGYNVQGLGTVYFRNDQVAASQYVQLLLGMRLKKDSIDLTIGASSEDYTKARKAGIYTSGGRGYLTNEQALAGVVKLYELNNGIKIKPSNVSISGCSQTYQEAVSKAYAIGLITDVKPQNRVTYGQLCDWLAQVM